MKTNKKIGGLFVVSALVMAMSTAAFAGTSATKTTTTRNSEGKYDLSMKGMHMQNLEELAAEKGITVDELKAQMEKEREDRLTALAAEKGITVDQLRTQMEAERGKNREERLAALAAEKGITVNELKVQMEKEREEKLAALAAEKGITVDELKTQMSKEGRKGFGPITKLAE